MLTGQPNAAMLHMHPLTLTSLGGQSESKEPVPALYRRHRKIPVWAPPTTPKGTRPILVGQSSLKNLCHQHQNHGPIVLRVRAFNKFTTILMTRTSVSLLQWHNTLRHISRQPSTWLVTSRAATHSIFDSCMVHAAGERAGETYSAPASHPLHLWPLSCDNMRSPYSTPTCNFWSVDWPATSAFVRNSWDAHSILA